MPTVLIENAPGSGDRPRGTGAHVRAALGLVAATPVVLYTGTFEAYQGLDLLYAAARPSWPTRPDARFVLVGGEPDQVERRAQQARARWAWRSIVDLHRAAAGRGDSRVSRRGDGARLAAQRRVRTRR